MRFPGGSSDAYNPSWVLPLSIPKVELTVLAGSEYRIRLELENRSRAVFKVPTSLNAVSVQKDGNRGRRTMLFVLILHDSRTGESQDFPIGVTDSSDDVPGSYFSLDPEQSVALVLGVPLRVQSTLQSGKVFKVRLRVTESLLRDSEFFIERESQPLISPEMKCTATGTGFTCE